MTAPIRRRMTADEFFVWALENPENGRCELVAGELVGMSPERAAHAETKALVWQALHMAIKARQLRCQAFPDGMSVRIDETTVYEPDALVRCGDPVPGDTLDLVDPVIVVEVVSPSSARRDTGAKLDDYFRLPSVGHYLIVKTDSRTVIHHARDTGCRIQTRILRQGSILLDPPGLTVEIASFFS